MSIPGFPQEIRPLLRGLVGKMMVHKLGLSLKKWGCKVFHSHEESSSMTFPNCRFFFGASTLQFWCGFWWRIWWESLLKMCVNVKICSPNCETRKCFKCASLVFCSRCFASQRKLGIMSPNLCCNNSKNRWNHHLQMSTPCAQYDWQSLKVQANNRQSDGLTPSPAKYYMYPFFKLLFASPQTWHRSYRY